MPTTLTIRQILFPTDFSPAAEPAGRAAAEFAQHFGARLHLLHVVPPVTDPTLAPEAFQALLATLPPGLPTQTEMVFGRPARQIVDYARRAGVDLIVMGTHGRTGFSHALLGSVAEAVIRRAPCRVLTVPAHLGEPAPPAAEALEDARRCLVCAQPSADLVCDPCRARIRGEALERKIGDERAGRR